ncbi:hypothetical protein, partial [Streptomyces sp. CC219B]|uniref:hypothetical protein n=1 Tax=Streptomyces sp. CC219B TaxID=3044574 RepID=UPI0024A97571
DGGSAQRQVVAGRLVANWTVKSGAEGVDGVVLETEPYVGVDSCGDADVGVAEEFLDHDEFDALFQEQGGCRVAREVGWVDQSAPAEFGTCTRGLRAVGSGDPCLSRVSNALGGRCPYREVREGCGAGDAAYEMKRAQTEGGNER